MQEYIERAIREGMTYKSYREKVNTLFEAGETTNSDNSESMLHYTQLNIQRMNKWDKIAKIKEASIEKMQALSVPEIWIVLTEGWCGDAAHTLPIIHKLSELSKIVEVKYILRDEHPELMNQFLTNGGKSIPKVIRLDASTKEVLSSWGPRPIEVQENIIRNKNAENPIPYSELSIQTQKWYAKDKGQTIQLEFFAQML
jgi:hypothetical protein